MTEETPISIEKTAKIAGSVGKRHLLPIRRGCRIVVEETNGSTLIAGSAVLRGMSADSLKRHKEWNVALIRLLQPVLLHKSNNTVQISISKITPQMSDAFVVDNSKIRALAEPVSILMELMQPNSATDGGQNVRHSFDIIG